MRTSVPVGNDFKVLAVWKGADLSGAPGAFTSRSTWRRRSRTCSSKVCGVDEALGLAGCGTATFSAGGAAEVGGREVEYAGTSSRAVDFSVLAARACFSL